MRIASVSLAVLLLGSCARDPKPAPSRTNASSPGKVPASPYDEAFWNRWRDGNAEVASYDLSTPISGQLQRGTAILITEMEAFSRTLRVRVDERSHAAADVVPVMRLNLIRKVEADFYRRTDTLNAFVWLRDVDKMIAGATAKVSFSRQDWSGHAWSQFLFGPEYVQEIRHSSFEGEADEQKVLGLDGEGISEDVLPLAARRIAWPRLRLGQSFPTRVLPSLEIGRARSGRVEWTRAELSLSGTRQTTIVPAGRFRTNTFTARWSNGKRKEFTVEADPPFRIVRWSASTGEKAELIGSGRMRYRELKGNAAHEALVSLGLVHRGAKMP